MDEIRIMKTGTKNSNRESIVLNASYVGITVNLLMAVIKAVVGFLIGSIAIITDAVNNLTDVLSSFVTLFGMKISMLRPDNTHPFGHGRFEDIATMIVGNMILLTGFFAAKESVLKIRNMTTAEYPVTAIVIMMGAIIIKVVLAVYFKKQGKKAGAEALIATGKDSESDALLTGAIVLSLILQKICNLNLEAIISTIISMIIMWNGIKIILGMIDELLGKEVDGNLLIDMEKQICAEPDVKNVCNLILHNYGPLTLIGSLDVQIDSTMQADKIVCLENKIKEIASREYGVRLTSVGIYV